MGATNGIPERMDQDTVIEMVDAGEYRRESFAITHESARVFNVEGAGWAQGKAHPYRIMVRDTGDGNMITIRAQSVVISAHTINSPSYSATKLHIGQTVKLMWPDGSLSDPYIIQARPESAAMLTPVK